MFYLDAMQMNMSMENGMNVMCRMFMCEKIKS